MYYHIYLCHGKKNTHHCVITQTLQNSQTLVLNLYVIYTRNGTINILLPFMDLLHNAWPYIAHPTSLLSHLHLWSWDVSTTFYIFYLLKLMCTLGIFLGRLWIEFKNWDSCLSYCRCPGTEWQAHAAVKILCLESKYKRKLNWMLRLTTKVSFVPWIVSCPIFIILVFIDFWYVIWRPGHMWAYSSSLQNSTWLTSSKGWSHMTIHLARSLSNSSWLQALS